MAGRGSACHHPQARAHDGRRRDRDEQTGQGFGVYGAPAGRRSHLTRMGQLDQRTPRGPCRHRGRNGRASCKRRPKRASDGETPGGGGKMKSERQPHATPQPSDVTIFRASRINVCCGALRRDWHKAADHTLIADGRFRGRSRHTRSCGSDRLGRA
jgi:hypothetical protein